MTTVTIKTATDVDKKYAILTEQSLNGESVYIKAKETLEAEFKDSNLSADKRAEVLASTVANMVNSITASCLSAAVDWAKYEKQIDLEKLKLGKELDILDAEKALKEAQAAQTRTANRLAKVESKRLYGTPTFDSGDNIISLADDGKVAGDIKLTAAQKDKVVVEKDLTEQKIKESYAAIHKIVADTYMNYGSYTWGNLTSYGLNDVKKNHTHTTLSDTQREIAIEQGKGYSYNAWANALTGSASMLGTAIGAGVTGFDKEGTTEHKLLNIMVDVATSLQKASTTAAEAEPTIS